MAWWSRAYEKAKQIASRYVQREVAKPAKAIETVKKAVKQVQKVVPPSPMAGVPGATQVASIGRVLRSSTPSPTPSYQPRPTQPGVLPGQGFTALPQQPSAVGGSYDPSTGTYTSPSGQGFSMAEQYVPPGTPTIGTTAPAPTTSPMGTAGLARQPALPGGYRERVEQAGMPRESYITMTGKYQYSAFTPEGFEERRKNMADSMLGFIPGGRKEISANINNPMLKKAAEWFAEHPYQAALYGSMTYGLYTYVAGIVSKGKIIAEGGTIIEGGVARAASGELAKIVPRAVAQPIINTVTAKTTGGIITRLSTGLGIKRSWFIAGMIYIAYKEASNYMYGLQYQANPTGDAIQLLNIGMGQAEKAGDIETAREYYEHIDAIANPDLWRKVQRFIPVINVLKGETEKREEGLFSATKIMERMERDYQEGIASDALAQKINDGNATNEEIAQYAKDNPFSIIAKNWINSQTNVDAQGNSIFGYLDEDRNYVPSPTEIAKEKWEQENQNVDALGNSIFGSINEAGVYVPSYTEMAKRLEQQQYYASLSGGGGGGYAPREWEPPSSLRFGLLYTSGYYKDVDESTLETSTAMADDQNNIGKQLYGADYADLAPEQRSEVDEILRMLLAQARATTTAIE